MVDEGIDQGAPQADAIVIKGNDQSSIKVARRNVEEAPNFDLPVFAQFQTPPTSTDLLQAFQSGASGLIVPEGTTNPIIDILNRNSARLSGSVTLEDVGLRAKDFNRFAPVLRQAGRIPLLARLPGEGNDPKKRDNDKNAESLFVGFDSTTDAATLDKIERAAKVGSTIYCEGALPSALWPRWSDISKLQLTQQKLRTQSVTLDDPWIWGTLNGQGFDVEQKMGVAVRTNLPPQIKEQKGEARETVARPLAKFEDGSNAIVLCPVGKGRIIWAPFDVARLHVSEDGTTGQAQKIAYYAAVSGVMQAALVQLTATRGDASAVSVALRGTLATPGDEKSLNGTLVAFFNSSKEPVDLEANVRGDGAYVLDLDTDTTIPAKVRDYGTRFSLSVPANGYRFVAIAKDAQTWNDTGKNSVRARLR